MLADAMATVRISDIADLNPDTYSPKENWPVVSYLDTGNITRGRIDSVQIIRPHEGKLPSRARRKVVDRDVVYSTVRPNQYHYGLLRYPPSNMLVSTGFTVVRANSDLISPEMLYLFLTEQSRIEMFQCIAEQSTSAYPSIKAEDIGAIELPVLKAQIREKLSSRLMSIFAAMNANEAQITTLSELRDALLPKLMSGKIDVSKVNIS